MTLETKLSELEKLSPDGILDLHEKTIAELTRSLDLKKPQEEIYLIWKKLDDLNSYISTCEKLVPAIKERYPDLILPDTPPKEQLEFFTQQTTEGLYQRYIGVLSNTIASSLLNPKASPEPPEIMYR